MVEAGFVWMDASSNRFFNAVLAVLGYIFFWGTEVLLLYWLVHGLAP